MEHDFSYHGCMSDEPNMHDHQGTPRRSGMIARLARGYLPSRFRSADAEAAIGGEGVDAIYAVHSDWVAEELRREEARDIAAKNTPRGRS
jgi:hypothetical protein